MIFRELSTERMHEKSMGFSFWTFVGRGMQHKCKRMGWVAKELLSVHICLIKRNDSTSDILRGGVLPTRFLSDSFLFSTYLDLLW